MTDPYRITDTPTPTSTPSSAGRLRPTLWFLLIVGLATNAVTSAIGATLFSIVAGLVTLACATALVVGHYRKRP